MENGKVGVLFEVGGGAMTDMQLEDKGFSWGVTLLTAVGTICCAVIFLMI